MICEVRVYLSIFMKSRRRSGKEVAWDNGVDDVGDNGRPVLTWAGSA